MFVNTQLYIAPYPTDQPAYWKLKLFITLNRNLMLTGATFLGICVILIITVSFVTLNSYGPCCKKCACRKKCVCPYLVAGKE